MKVIKSDTAEYFENSPDCKGKSFKGTGQDINGATIRVDGRYPDAGYLTNEVCKELVYVTAGSGELISPDVNKPFGTGDVVFVDKQEVFAWQGTFEGFFVCTPAFYPEQHKEVSL